MASLDFIGRTKEQQMMEDRWRSESSEFLVLYGRRRVGKTELLRQFSHRKKTLFSVGTRSDSRSQIRHFLTELARVAGEPDLDRLPISDWDTVFGRLTTALNKSRGKTLVIFDEFQWMVQASPELPSLIQKWWDKDWGRKGKLFLILCGSYMGFMEREVLAHKSPLFGRRTAVLHLKPLTFLESRHFHRRLSLKEQVKRYMVCGGIPAYHKLFTSNESLTQQLINSFFELDAPLAKEADFLLMEELKEPKLYFSLLECLGTSQKGMTELATALGIERSRIPYYTRVLMDLQYLGKSAPLLAYNDVSERKSAYRIKDPLLRFWFTFVYPNTNILERVEARIFFATVISPQLDAYWGVQFEKVAMELFLSKKILPSLAEPFKTGNYWDKTIQIDFVIALKSGLSYFGEVKWNRLTHDAIQSFLKKTERFREIVSPQPIFISGENIPASIKKNQEGMVYSLSDLV